MPFYQTNFFTFTTMFHNIDHLRITKVRTTDGTTPVIGSDEKPVKKIIFAPATKDAIKQFNDQNTRLPNQLKMKIEHVKGYTPQPIVQGPDPVIADMQRKIEELEAANKMLSDGQKSPKQKTENEKA